MRTLKASFDGFLLSTLDECLMVLHLVQHSVEAENRCEQLHNSL